MSWLGKLFDSSERRLAAALAGWNAGDPGVADRGHPARIMMLSGRDARGPQP